MTASEDRHATRLEVHDEPALTQRAASLVADALRAAVATRGRATLAVSGGSTPGPMFTALAEDDVPWDQVHVLQVDERVAPDGDGDRNLTDLREQLLDRVPIARGAVHAVPVGDLDPQAAAASYRETLLGVAGSRPVVDVVHLGLGADGHTASLVPGDAGVDERELTVVATGPYEGRRRVTLTVPVLRAARLQLWLVAGSGKAAAVRRLLAGDPTIPASLVLSDDAVVLVDPAAAEHD